MINLYLGDYKRYLIFPAVLFAVFLFLIFVYPGVKPGIDLTGGTNIIVRSDAPLDKSLLEPVLRDKYSLSELQLGSVSSPSGYGVFIQFSEEENLAQARALLAQAKNQLESSPEAAKASALESISFSSRYAPDPGAASMSPPQAVDQAGVTLEEAEESFQLDMQETIRGTFGLGSEMRFQKREIGPSLGESFFSLGLTVSLMGFALVIIVIFLFFREVIPSAAVVLAVLFDISGALALMSVFAIPLSLSTIPALLMLIGYSVDTDLMLTTRLLKRKDADTRERAHGSMITGLTMTLTTLAALAAMLIMSYFGQIQVVFEISAVLLFGLFADIISTWLMNAPVLLWYAEKKEGKA